MSEPLKLYVAGEHSANPDEWDKFGGWYLVLAESPEQAMAMTKEPVATEVAAERPCIIHAERTHGDRF